MISVQAKRIYERGNNPADIDTEGGVIELGFGPREASVRGENGGLTEDPRISDYLFADTAGDEFQSDHEFMEKAIRGSYYGRGSRLVAAVAGAQAPPPRERVAGARRDGVTDHLYPRRSKKNEDPVIPLPAVTKY